LARATAMKGSGKMLKLIIGKLLSMRDKSAIPKGPFIDAKCHLHKIVFNFELLLFCQLNLEIAF
jgi:hypothetical protein